ncbi:MAG TPA: UDP-N-acetylmuramate--L-alanine ligase [Candidatus Babeliales bacterium]|jgi:UDP-N-acetylmuramate--alanine ligase|nr:UDP-N-acetylmuramate--L-alanine ligase [Candidatus Babeliales bacterium]
MKKQKHIHFVGIGGIGMSGIATILAKQGYVVSGCDADIHQKNIHALISLGCTIYHGNNSPGCSDLSIDTVVYSSAIKQNNPELIAAKQRGVMCMHRSEMLAQVMRSKYSIAVTGAHGKTTTSSMIAHMLLYAQTDPTIIIGGHLKNIDHNARYGNGTYLVAEADESDKSLLNVYPTIALITNIDFEHPETYSSLDEIKSTYLQFLSNIPASGAAVLCIDDSHIRALLPSIQKNSILYGLDTDAQIRGLIIELAADYSKVAVYSNQIVLGTITIGVPGKHNVLNALGATATALHIGLPFAVIQEALATFSGVERRFCYHGIYNGAKVFDDYGHHPTEIACTLSTAQLYTQKGITVVFQPHRFIRTKVLWNQFIDIFVHSTITNLIITDIYGAGEQPIDGVSGYNLVNAIKACNPQFNITYIPYDVHHQQIKNQINYYTQLHDVILLLGAGNINKVASTLLTSDL